MTSNYPDMAQTVAAIVVLDRRSGISMILKVIYFEF